MLSKPLTREEAAAEIDREEREKEAAERERQITRRVAEAKARVARERAAEERKQDRDRELNERMRAAMKRAEKQYGKDVAGRIEPLGQYDVLELAASRETIQVALTYERKQDDVAVRRAIQDAQGVGFVAKRGHRYRGIELPDHAPRLRAVDPDLAELRKLHERVDGLSRTGPRLPRFGR